MKKIMWGKWIFPTSHDLLHLPWNYGCEILFLENLWLDLELYRWNARNTKKNGVNLLEGSRTHLFENFKFGICHYFLLPSPWRIPWKNFQFVMRGTLKVFPRLIPVDFFENLWRSRPLSYRQKNLKKIARKRIKVVLEINKVRCCILNRFRFPTHSKNLSKKIWGRPISPAPAPKNFVKILSVDVDDMFKFTEFRWSG